MLSIAGRDFGLRGDGEASICVSSCFLGCGWQSIFLDVHREQGRLEEHRVRAATHAVQDRMFLCLRPLEMVACVEICRIKISFLVNRLKHIEQVNAPVGACVAECLLKCSRLKKLRSHCVQANRWARATTSCASSSSIDVGPGKDEPCCRWN